MTQRLHHMAFRCRDSEETRIFYEEVMGLTLAGALDIDVTKTGRPVKVLHTFFRLGDGSHVAFFEAPDDPFEFKPQADFDLHIALEADQAQVDSTVAEARRRGIEVRGPSDHGFVRSTYFRDPNGYVVELAVKTEAHRDFERDGPAEARRILEAWNRGKAKATQPA
jgi:catechol 2,3-dioxygenase-like lactoylglutathione lyase family enzyme